MRAATERSPTSARCQGVCKKGVLHRCNHLRGRHLNLHVRPSLCPHLPPVPNPAIIDCRNLSVDWSSRTRRRWLWGGGGGAHASLSLGWPSVSANLCPLSCGRCRCPHRRQMSLHLFDSRSGHGKQKQAVSGNSIRGCCHRGDHLKRKVAPYVGCPPVVRNVILANLIDRSRQWLRVAFLFVIALELPMGAQKSSQGWSPHPPRPCFCLCWRSWALATVCADVVGHSGLRGRRWMRRRHGTRPPQVP